MSRTIAQPTLRASLAFGRAEVSGCGGHDRQATAIGMPSALVIGWATLAMVVGLFPVFALGVLTPFIAADVGVTPATAGLLSTGLFGAAAVGSAPAGRLVDRFGPGPGLTLLFLCAAASWRLGAGAHTVPISVAAVTLAGAAMAMAIPATTRLLFDLLRGRALGLALGIAHSGTQLGAMVAGGVLPTLAVVLGWREAVRAMALLPLIAIVLPLIVLRRRLGGVVPRPATARTSFVVALREIPGLSRIAAFAFTLNAVVTFGVLNLPSYATVAFELDLVTAGLTTLLMGAASVAGKILWGASRLRSGRRGLLVLVASSATVIALLLIAPALGTWALWTGSALFGFTATTWAVTTTQTAGVHSGTARSGSASGTVMLAGYAGGASGPPLLGLVVSGSGFTVAWLAAIGILGSAAWLLRRLQQPKDTPAGGTT